MKFKYSLLFVATVFMVWLLVTKNHNMKQNPDHEYVEMHGAVWNTTYNIKYQGPENLTDDVLNAMKEVDMSLSCFNPASRLSAINSNESMEVDDLILSTFEYSTNACRLSNGAFDPTVAPLIDLWGFGTKGHEVKEPSDAEIEAALEHVGITECEITGKQMHKKSPLTTFNFSAVAKGAGCDLIADIFRENNVKNFMIEIGGELVLSGVNPRGEKWHVMLDAPVMSEGIEHTSLAKLNVTDCAIATSGNYRNYRQHGDTVIGHTISPVTGRPINTPTLSATVVATTCMSADALATACMAMDPDSALSMINRVPHAHCLLVVKEQDKTEILKTHDFPELH